MVRRVAGKSGAASVNPKKSRSAPFIFGSRWVARPMQITGEKRFTQAGRLGFEQKFFVFFPVRISRGKEESQREEKKRDNTVGK
jgi:hypothetical protein